MLSSAGVLLSLSASQRQRVLQAWASRQCHSLSRDVSEANQELEEFFGVSHTRSGALGASLQATSNNANDPTSQPLNSPSCIPTASNPYETYTTGGSANGVLGDCSSTTQHPASAPQRLPAGPPHSPHPFHPPQYTHVSRQHAPQHLQTPPPPLLHHQQQSEGLHAETRQQPTRLTHIDASGSASMVDVSQKDVTVREAQASCVVTLGAAYEAVAANTVAKGNVMQVAQLAGICGAKATASLIPLCHNIPISKVDVQLSLDEPSRAVLVRALARTDGKTGVEMEALTAAAVAALTVYDMCKAAAKDMVVGALQLDYKAGGRSGMYLRAGLTRANLLPSARPPL